MDDRLLTPRHPVVRARQEQSDLSATWPAGSSVVILSGGTSRRLGLDKATRHVGGRTMLARLLAQIPPTVPIILVGPGSPDLPGRVVTVREDPPGTGPLAGSARACKRCGRRGSGSWPRTCRSPRRWSVVRCGD